MALMLMPLNDLEGHICCLKPFKLPYLVKHSTNLLTKHIMWSLCKHWASFLICN